LNPSHEDDMKNLQQDQVIRFAIAGVTFPVLALLCGPATAYFIGFVVATTIGFLLWGFFWVYSDPLDWHAPVALSAGGIVTVATAAIYQGLMAPTLANLRSTDDPSAFIGGLASQVLDSSHGPEGLFIAMTAALWILAGRQGGAGTGGFAGAAIASIIARYALGQANAQISQGEFGTIEDWMTITQSAWVMVPIGAFVGVRIRRIAVAAELRQRAHNRQERLRLEWALEQRALGAGAPEGAIDDSVVDQHVPEEVVSAVGAVVETQNAGMVDRTEDIEDTLLSTPMFTDVSGEDLLSLVRQLTIEHFLVDDVLFEEGEVQASLFIIRKGSIAIRKSIEGGESSTELARLYPGAVLGEMAVVESQPRSATAVAMETTEVIRIDASQLHALYNRVPSTGVKVQEYLIRMASERLQQASYALFGEPPTNEAGSLRGGRQQGEYSELKRDEAQAVLTSLPLFRDMGPEDYDALAPILGKVRFDADAYIAVQGDVEPCMYLITTGTAEVWLSGGSGERIVLAKCGTGNPIGEMALFLDSPRSAHVTASGPVDTVVISRAPLLRLGNTRPKVATKLYAALLELVSRRLRRTSAQMADRAASSIDNEVGTAQDLGQKDAASAPVNDTATGGETATESVPIEEPNFEVAPEDLDPLLSVGEDPFQWRLRTSQIAPLVVVAALCWVCTPRWSWALHSLPDPATSVAVPVLEPGLSTVQSAVDPFGPGSRDLVKGLAKGRVSDVGSWPCMPDARSDGGRYGVFPRHTVTVAVDASRTVRDLYPLLQGVRSARVYRVAFLGQSPGLEGLEHRLAGWPVVSVLLDRPPRSAHWLRLTEDDTQTLDKLTGAGRPDSCAILVDDDVTVERLQKALQRLERPKSIPNCRGMFTLVLASDVADSSRHPGWQGCH
jgi:CRP/FNR family transcriptional regulator, cyclic AMP receptor protein